MYYVDYVLNTKLPFYKIRELGGGTEVDGMRKLFQEFSDRMSEAEIGGMEAPNIERYVGAAFRMGTPRG